MNFVALRMLVGDRAKYLGIIFGLTFASLLITQQMAIFVGLMTRTYSAITDLRVLFWKQAEIMGTTMANHAEFETVMRLVVRGDLRPVVDTTMPLDQAAKAHERLEAGQQFGKIVLLP